MPALGEREKIRASARSELRLDAPAPGRATIVGTYLANDVHGHPSLRPIYLNRDSSG